MRAARVEPRRAVLAVLAALGLAAPACGWETPPPLVPVKTAAEPSLAPARAPAPASKGTFLSVAVSLPPASPAGASGTSDGVSVAADATFRDLVQAAGRPSRGTSACILAGGAAGHAAVLRAPVAARASDLELPPDDLDDYFRKQTGPVRVDVRAPWGCSATQYDLDLVALTPASRALTDAAMTVIFVTNEGYWGTHAGALKPSEPPLPMSADQLTELVEKDAKLTDAWVIAAEGDAPIARLRRALAALPRGHGTVILATPLARPRPPDASMTSPWLSPGDLDACPNGAEPTPSPLCGVAQDAAARAVASAIAPCVDLVPNDGGRLNLELRFSPGGHVEGSCATQDSARSDSLRDCMVTRAKGLTVPRVKSERGAVLEVVATLPGPRYDALCDP